MLLGEKTTISAAYVKDNVEKNGWRVSVFEGTVRKEFFPDQLCDGMEGKKTNFVAKGTFTPAYEGELLDLTGEWTYEKKRKEYIFSIEFAVPNVPCDPKDVMTFLTHAVKGIGPVMAKDIFDWCGGDLTKVSNEPVLAAASVKRLTERKAKLLAAKIEEASISASLSRLLNSVVDSRIIHRLVTTYGRDAYEMVTKSPYDSVSLIGFDAADTIALAQKFDKTSPARIRGAALSALAEIKAKNNSILADRRFHLRKMGELLDRRVPAGICTPEMVNNIIHAMIDDKTLGVTKSFVYLYEDFVMEKTLAQKIYDLGQETASEEEAARFCAAFDKWQENNPNIHLHINQSNAVYGAANLFSVVTGGPGTGKTTVLKAIMETYEILFPDSPITLMAPTGLAAKRMTESCERNAKTIHKALNLVPAPTASGFDDSNGQQIHGGLIIVDEFSMVGIHLANFLISAIDIRQDTRIVFVGDVDQLPPVTPGTVLKDLIDCERVHVTRLTKNFRQAGGSNIADVAVKVNTGNIKGLTFKDDCIFTAAANDAEIRDLVEKEFLKSVSEFGLEQTYVITPTHKNEKDPLSSNSLNKRLQELVNPSATEVSIGNWVFRVGDRVINKKNTDEVINGDIGVIEEIIPEDIGVSLRIMFSGNEVVLPPERLKNLELAYAITVHSSQGCEFKSVITPISESHHMMLSRNLTYTAITRAKKKMHLIGIRSEMDASIANIKEGAAGDMLCKRIQNKKKISPKKNI